jgi:hypothetical protein
MAKSNQTTSADVPRSIAHLARTLKVGKQALHAALVNVTPAAKSSDGHAMWTEAQSRAALEAAGSRGTMGPLKDQKLQEQIRQLKLINDRKAGTLVERSLVAGAFGRIASKIAEARTQSESQAPLRMVGKDVAEIREEVRKVWDTIGHVLASCAVEFEEKPK